MSEEILNPVSTGLTINESVKADLLSAAKWAKFLCIVGCIGVGIMVIAGILMMVFGTMASSLFSNMPLGAAMGFIYLILAAIYIYPLIKGFQFANGVKAACLTNNEQELARGFAGLNALLRFTGILTIIILSIYVIILIFGVGVAAAIS